MIDGTDTPLIVIGAGGHAKVIVEALRQMDCKILGFTEFSDYGDEPGPFGMKIIGNDDVVFSHGPNSIRLINGIGSLPGSNARWLAYERFADKGYRFASVVHPKSHIAEDVTLGEGCQVMAGAVIQTGTRVGRQVIVNTSATIDHDCLLGDGVHVAPGATLSGGVAVGDRAHIGTGASVIQSISIGANAVVGAGAVVVKDVPAGIVVTSVAARASGDDA